MGEPARLEPAALLARFTAVFGDAPGARIASAPGSANPRHFPRLEVQNSLRGNDESIRGPSPQALDRKFHPVQYCFPLLGANLIGEHVDYQDGLVLPFAIERRVWVVFRPRADARLVCVAEDLDQRAEVDLEVQPTSLLEPKWLRYCAAPFLWQRRTTGCDLLVASDVPRGGGVSSSSAVVVACTLAATDKPRSRKGMLMLAAEAEWAFSGLKGGVMDHFASLYSKQGHVCTLDCRSGLGVYAEVSAAAVCFVVANTNVAHSLVDSPYARRRESCERLVKAMAARFTPLITHLRDASDRGLTEAEAMIATLLEERLVTREDANRGLHSVRENLRVREASVLLSRGDWAGLGRLLDEAHESLRALYEVSCPELDLITQIARSEPGCFGSRMMGGGFGGCAIAICTPDSAERLMAKIKLDYKKRTAEFDEWRDQGGLDATIFIARPSQGATLSSGCDPLNLSTDWRAASDWRVALLSSSSEPDPN